MEREKDDQHASGAPAGAALPSGSTPGLAGRFTSSFTPMDVQAPPPAGRIRRSDDGRILLDGLPGNGTTALDLTDTLTAAIVNVAWDGCDGERVDHWSEARALLLEAVRRDDR